MRIASCTHAGLEAVTLETSALRLVGVHGLGPRLAWLSQPGGENLLFWDEAEPPRIARQEAGHNWTLRGGHRVWTARGPADESEETYANDDAPGTCILRSDGFTLAGAEDPVTRTRRGLDVQVLADDRLRVVNWLVNEGSLLYGCGLWALTCTLPGPETCYVVPLGDGSSWDTATITVFRTWTGHGSGSFSEAGQFTLGDDAYLLRPRGIETKRMVRAEAGRIVMSDPGRGCSLAISSPLQVDAVYPVNANVALYVGPDNFMVEMETMGPQATLKPGGRVEHVQEWRLVDHAIEASGAAALALG